jgi:hypothetical protein
MTKKRIILSASTIQLLLVAALFLPAGKITGPDGSGESTLSVFGMIRRYAGMGFSDDALFFTIFSCCIPAANILFPFLLKKRLNFGVPACLSAFHALVAACFFSSARVKMVDSVGMTGLHYVLILLAVVSLFLYIFGYFLEKQE